MTFYNSIDNLPIWNFYKVKETGDLSYMFIDEALHGKAMTQKVAKELFEAWKAIDDRFLFEYGLTEQYVNRMIIEKKILQLELDVLINNDSITRSRLKAEKAKIEGVKEQEGKANLVEVIVNVEKFMNFSIEEKKVCVSKFFGYIELMKRSVKKLKEKDNG
jgi:hypothetical protein